MSKEIVVSSARHETRLAVLEDDQLVELFIERESQEGLAGSIHKGRVTRVLPGMQSAFVDVGLERDAFLYVSDFVDSSSEFDDSEEEGNAAPRRRSGRSRAKTKAEAEAETEPEPEQEQSESDPQEEPSRDGGRERRARRRRGRRGRRRGGKERLPESKYAKLPDKADESEGDVADEKKAVKVRDEEPRFELLPGESLAKYGDSGDARGLADNDSLEEAGESTEEPAALDADHRKGGDARGTDDDAASEAPDDAETGGDEDEDRRAEDAETDEEDGFGDDEDSDEDEEDEDGDVDEDDEDDDGPDFTHDLEEAERLAALVEEEDTDEENDLEEESGDEDDDSEDGNGSDDEDEQPESKDAGDEEEEASKEEPASNDEDARGADDGRPQRPAAAGAMPGQPLEETPEEAKKAEARSTAKDDTSGEETAPPPIPGKPGSARVRGRSGSFRNLQRRGRRGRRRGGRGRDNRQPVQEREPQEQERRKPARETSLFSGTNTSEYKITDMLQKGNEILVQIAKEPLGKKGARITSHIALPGRFLVYMPTVDHVGVSRKIGSFDERKRLRQIVRTHRTGMPGGFIVRTAGEGIPEEDIRGDMLFLYNLWLDIRQKAEERENPGLVHQDLDIVERTLRDQLDEDFKAIWVDAEDEYERILRFVERFQPSLLPRVKLYTRSRPIFEEFNVQTALEKALRPKVWLKSGGYIVINQTEALVAVDVNTGKYVGKSDRLEDTIVNTNIEAAKELVRQLRLRDLGGIIVVDFIDMDDRKNRQKVFQALEQALKTDRAPSKTLPFNDFGLVAITRKRVKQSLERTLCDACPTCTGSGRLKSVTTVIFEILEEAGRMAPDMDPQRDVTLRVNPEIARTLKSRKNSYLQEIETLLKSRVLVRSDGSLHRENFDIN